MNILVISPVLPYPPYDGDRVRIFNFIKELSRKNKIYLVSFIGKGEEPNIKGIKKFCKEVKTVKISRMKIYLNILKSFFTGAPLNSGAYYSKNMQEEIDRGLETKKIDSIFTYRLRMAQYVASKKIPKAIDIVDALSLYMKRSSKFEKNPLRRIYNMIDRGRVLRYEKSVARHFNYVFINSEEDAKFLGKSNIVVIPNGAYKGTNKGSGIRDKGVTIGFFGNMEYAPNKDAVVYFCKNMWKNIENSDYNVKLVVIGDKSGRIGSIVKGRNIIVKGFIENIDKEVARWGACIVPVRYGAGRQNKTLQSWANRVPVVSTSFAAKGVYGKNRVNMLVADEPEKFIKNIFELKKNRKLASKITAGGLKTLKKNFDWKKSGAKLEKTIRNMLR